MLCIMEVGHWLLFLKGRVLGFTYKIRTLLSHGIVSNLECFGVTLLMHLLTHWIVTLCVWRMCLWRVIQCCNAVNVHVHGTVDMVAFERIGRAAYIIQPCKEIQHCNLITGTSSPNTNFV